MLSATREDCARSGEEIIEILEAFNLTRSAPDAARADESSRGGSLGSAAGGHAPDKGGAGTGWLTLVAVDRELSGALEEPQARGDAMHLVALTRDVSTQLAERASL
jgi:hypothetical protein